MGGAGLLSHCLHAVKRTQHPKAQCTDLFPWRGLGGFSDVSVYGLRLCHELTAGASSCPIMHRVLRKRCCQPEGLNHVASVQRTSTRGSWSVTPQSLSTTGYGSVLCPFTHLHSDLLLSKVAFHFSQAELRIELAARYQRAIYFAAYSGSKERLNGVLEPDSTPVHMLSAGLAVQPGGAVTFRGWRRSSLWLTLADGVWAPGSLSEGAGQSYPDLNRNVIRPQQSERERVCVCVRERERPFVCVCERERAREKRERERECVCVWERERERESGFDPCRIPQTPARTLSNK
ncbi:hypothetical protein JZ751_027121 [Albula glossodonta]|uniref:Uncharacterized protein n=1 Tax=Albula glossodonta TaxID=121402 RepID=A0A8T2MVZ3_9TELE|nr:hypothetical protein JZ751_027121 [Albula glossodonta]